MAHPETVSVKEFLELKIAYEAREVCHIREILTEREKALKLKTDIDAKHFADLNHEAERLRTMQATYIPREVYNAEIEQLKKESVENKEWRANREGRESKSIWISIIALIVSIVLAFIQFKT